MGVSMPKPASRTPDEQITFLLSDAVQALDHAHLPHHAGVFMLQNVAMKHVQPLVALHQLDAYRLTRFGVDHVAPGKQRLWCDLAVHLALDHLELHAMNVKRVIHVGLVGKLPQLDFVDAAAEVNALHVKTFTVDQKLHAVQPS